MTTDYDCVYCGQHVEAAPYRDTVICPLCIKTPAEAARAHAARRRSAWIARWITTPVLLLTTVYFLVEFVSRLISGKIPPEKLARMLLRLL